MTDVHDISALRAEHLGPVLVPGDPGYDEARRVWNADVDRRPAVIARCRSAADVVAAVRFGVRHDLEIAVRGGGHSVSGASVVDDGLMIDLGALNAVAVDPQARRARVQGGALLGDLLTAAQEHGLAMPVGAIAHTGVGGLTLGGGMGWLSRLHGLSIDNLLSAQVVLADGRTVRAASDEHPDLFWALRGGGGNFGVVTEFEFQLHPVGPLVEFAMLFWGLEHGRQALGAAREVMADLPPGVNVVLAALNAPPEPFVPAEHHFRPGYAVLVTGFGSAEEHAGVVGRLQAGTPPLWQFGTTMPYLAVQTMLDEANAWGQHYYEKSLYLEDLDDDVVDALLAHVPQKTSPTSVVLTYRLDGAYSQVGDDDTAFSGGRSPRYATFVIAVCQAAEQLPAERTWVRGLHAALEPYAADGTYVNGIGEAVDDARVRASYGDRKYERLAQVKAVYDPGNAFRRNANIRPAVRPPAQRVGASDAAPALRQP